MTKLTVEEVMRKAQTDEPLTVEEVAIYEANRKPVDEVYGKYGNMAKAYMEENKFAEFMDLGADIPRYFHEIDRKASEMYDTMYASLSKQDEFKRTGDYITDVRRLNQIKAIIEEHILHELVYV